MGMVGREAFLQLPDQDQALDRCIPTKEAPSVYGNHLPLRETFSQASPAPNHSGGSLSRLVYPSPPRLRPAPVVDGERFILSPIPFMNPDPALIQKLSGLEGHLSSKIRGQGHVIPRVCSVLERGELGLQPPDKPLGSFLFLGPTGVGKTELTLVCSRYLFGEGALHRFDMSEFQHLDSVKLFLGDETGMPGRLGKVLESHSRGILLFDEVEKAHRLIWDLFLQMLDAARITLADHRTHDLSGFYVVCTSNIGSQQLMRPTRLPFATLERAVLAELHRHFRPELIGRFDEKVVFRPLTPETQREIAMIVINKEVERYQKMGIQLAVDEETIEMLIRKGITKALGARPMKRTVQKYLGDMLRERLMNP